VPSKQLQGMLLRRGY